MATGINKEKFFTFLNKRQTMMVLQTGKDIPVD